MTITRVGILGGEPLGGAFARALARAEIRPVLSQDSWAEDALSTLLADIGDVVSVTSHQAAAEEDVVFLAVPWTELAETLAAIADWESRILIDATNRTPTAGEPVDNAGVTSSEIVRNLSPGAQLVKAFNGLPAETLAADPRPARAKPVVFLAGDHARAKLEVSRLVTRIGLAAVDLGDLASGGKLLQYPEGALWGKSLLSVEL